MAGNHKVSIIDFPPHLSFLLSVHPTTVASSSAGHDLHSNWVLRVPRVADDSEQKVVRDCANESVRKKKNQNGSTSSRLRLQRNPIHLPKVVESAFQTLRFKPKLKKAVKPDGHLKPAALPHHWGRPNMFGQTSGCVKYPSGQLILAKQFPEDLSYF